MWGWCGNVEELGFWSGCVIFVPSIIGHCATTKKTTYDGRDSFSTSDGSCRLISDSRTRSVSVLKMVLCILCGVVWRISKHRETNEREKRKNKRNIHKPAQSDTPRRRSFSVLAHGFLSLLPIAHQSQISVRTDYPDPIQK